MTSPITARRRVFAPRALRGVLLALPCLLPGSLLAQRVVTSVDVGGAQVRYADSLAMATASVSPAIQLRGDRATLGAAGSVSQLPGGWSTQGMLHASLFTAPAGLLVGELSGSAGGSAHRDGTRTGRSLGSARAHLMSASRGVWAGAGAGTTWGVGGWQGMQLAEVGAWSRVGVATAMATFTPTRVADTLRYADAEGALRVELPRLELGLTAGYRAGEALPVFDGSPRSWGSVSAVGWIARRVALVASAGTYPVDLTQGFPGGRFASLGMRFGTRPLTRRERPADQDGSAAVAAVASGGTEVLEIRVAPAGLGHAVRVHAPQATSVQLKGDFSGWRPVRMTHAGDGWWTVSLPLMSGMREVMVRVDDGEWIAPPGLATMRDEFGGVVGLLAVP